MAVVVPPEWFDPQNPHPQPTSAQVTVGQAPTLILPNNYRRFSASVKNVGSDTVWIGSRSTATPAQGHALGAGEVINIATPTELWGYANSGNQLVTYLDEYVR